MTRLREFYPFNFVDSPVKWRAHLVGHVVVLAVDDQGRYMAHQVDSVSDVPLGCESSFAIAPGEGSVNENHKLARLIRTSRRGRLDQSLVALESMRLLVEMV